MISALCFGVFHKGNRAARVFSFFIAFVGTCFFPLTLSGAPAITYVQGTYTTPQSPQTTVNVTFTGAQTAGNLNVVVVGWNDSTATVSSVADKSGNTYTRAVGPTMQSGIASQSIYYAKNIAAAAAGANTVTVTFSTPAAYPDIRVLEYTGADPVNPVDVFAASSGNSSSSSSGAATTTNATDLIFGANLVQTLTSGPGSSFTSRLLTQPDGDIAEDRMVTSTGSYSATAPLSSGQWIMQMVAFRAFVGTSPTITSLSPNTGSTAGGTSVTVTGTNFGTGAAVTFGTAAATNVVVVNSTTITATTPPGSAGAVTVTVTLNGQSGSLANGFTYVAPPTVTRVSPNTGTTAGGTSVTITGTNFAAGATVSFGSAAASNVSVVNSTTITATTPIGSAGPVTVTVIVKGVTGSLANAFTYVVVPTVTSVSPNSGTSAGGTSVTITGTNFAVGATVTFGPSAATNVAVVSSTSITATTPAGSAGVVTVTVTVNGQSGSLVNGFTYIASPTVIAVNPNTGSTSGGTSVTITGTNFASGATVAFGANAATNVIVVNSTSITAITPAGGAGPVTVTVTNPGSLSGSLTNGFTYAVIPTISSVSPNTGPIAGGTSVTITGTNFSSGATVTFGSASASNVVVVSSTSITATTPAGNAGAVTVTVTLNGQSGSLTNGFTYVGPPTVTAVNPNSGSTAGGTSVTISGTNFAAGASVTFGGTAATNVAVVNSTSITATTPAGPAGKVTVTVTNSDSQTGSLANAYTYVTPSTPTAPGNLAVGGGPAPIVSAVQSYINSNSLTSHTTGAFDSTGGDLIVLLASSHAGVTFTPSDTFGNTWIPIAGPTNTTTGFDLRTEMWYARNPIVGSGQTVTMGLSAAQSLVMSIFVVKAANASSPIEAISLIGSDNGTQSTSITSPTITTTSANDLLIGFVKVSAGATFTSGTGFTQQPAASSNFLDAESGVATTPGNYAATFTISSAQTWQSSVVAASPDPTQSTLSWNASTESGGTISMYLVERCQGVGCGSFSQIGTTTGTTFNDTGLAPSTAYTYRVRAQDTSNNVGPYSNVVAFTTPPTIPAAPGNVTATAASSQGINLSWIASAENGGTVASYSVERCTGASCTNFAQIGTALGSTYNDTGLTSATTYTYRVRAFDSFGNSSPYSNVAVATTPPQGGTINYVQANSASPQSPQSTVNVSFTGAQTAGNLNVVVVGWNDSNATVSSVMDKSGNVYTRAVGPTVQSGVASQAIYYAPNIKAVAAGANSVTVMFSASANYPDIRILEYTGADPNIPVDVFAASSGSGTTSSSGAVTTTNATDLLFGANLVQTTTTGPGNGFISRLVTQPDGDIVEDRMVAATGSYTATAPLTSGQWIMQMVAFRAAGTSSAAAPTTPSNLAAVPASSTQINLSWSASTSSVGVANYIVQRCMGAGCNNFAQLAAPTGVAYTDIGLNPSTSYSYRIQAVDTSGDVSPFSGTATTTTLASSSFAVTPRAAVVTYTKTQQFTSTGGTVTWAVDGIVGGSASIGTISAAGLYTPPSTVGSHAITATTTNNQQATATVYVSNYAGTFTHHNDNLRTGQNTGETVLTPSNVNQVQFGKLFSYPLDGYSYASPLYVANVNISGQGFHNVVYIATEHDSVYAYDADGASTSPLWKVSFLKNGATTVPCADVGECGDIPNEIGITATPVIDPTTGTLYVVAKTKENNNYVQRLHALEITTGVEKFGGPVVLQASEPGNPPEGGTTVVFNPLRENQRTGLLLLNGIVYFGFGSHGDQQPWHGWILGYNASTLQQVMAYCSTPNANGAGIWQSGGGLATDASGNIFFSSGNGAFDANVGGRDYGDSVVKISTNGVVQDYFTPYNQANLDNTNVELGSAGPVLLLDQPTGSHPHILVTAGKNGTIYVVDRDNMGHFNSSGDTQIIQSLPGALLNSDQESGNFSSPVYFNGYVYFAAVNDTLKAFLVSNGLLSSSPTSTSVVTYPNRGGSFAISANGTSSGILWAMQDNSPNPGILRAYDATNLSSQLYDSSQAGSRDALADAAAKFSIPLVANGKVFVVTLGSITAYGLLP